METSTNLHLTGFIKEIKYQPYFNQPHNKLVIQESKNTLNDSIPQLVDLQQALCQFILYSNIDSLYLDGQKIDFNLKLKLTSKKLISGISLPVNEENSLENFLGNNAFINAREKKIIKQLNKKTLTNKFIIEFKKS
jgi:hypothetical protein